MIELDKIHHGDCLELMREIPDESIDAIICDLPYNTTGMKWDCAIPFEPLWDAYTRIIKPNGAIVLFCQQPFTTYLISSNIKMWKYNWIWEKEMGTNFVNANYCPLKKTEDIAVFSYGGISYSPNGIKMKYNPQKTKGKPYVCKNGNKRNAAYAVMSRSPSVCGHVTVNEGERYPTNILRFNRDRGGYHPTQKPVDLLRYLVLTYTDKQDTILDNCCGSGSLAVACIREKRHFICIEKEKKYYDIACKRVKEELQQPKLF